MDIKVMSGGMGSPKKSEREKVSLCKVGGALRGG